MNLILITYQEMHPLKNAYQELLKLIRLNISQYILHSNSQITSHNTITQRHYASSSSLFEMRQTNGGE